MLSQPFYDGKGRVGYGMAKVYLISVQKPVVRRCAVKNVFLEISQNSQ